MRTTLLAALLATSAFASSHREAPMIAQDPAADNTDLWAWVKPGTHDKLYIVAAYNPLEEPSGGPNFHSFSDDVLYEIHIARGASTLDDAVTYQIRFRTQSVQRVAADNLALPPGGGKEFFTQLSAQAGGGFPVQTYTVTRVSGGASKSSGWPLRSSGARTSNGSVMRTPACTTRSVMHAPSLGRTPTARPSGWRPSCAPRLPTY